MTLEEHRRRERERRRLEEEQRHLKEERLKEEQRRLEEEHRKKEAEEHARRLRQQEEQEERRKAESALQLDYDSEAVSSLPDKQVDISGRDRSTVNEMQVSRDLKRDSIERTLDSEVTDVLFQFDTIVSELERESNLSDAETANKSDDEPVQTEMDQSNEEAQSTKSDQVNRNSNSQPDDKKSSPKLQPKSVASLADRFTGVSSSAADERWSKSPFEPEVPIKANIKELKQQFLSPSPSESQSRSPTPGRDAEVLSKAGKVKNIIAQMQTTRQSQTPPPTTSSGEPSEGDEMMTVVRRQRERSPSISKRITQIAQDLEETEQRQSRSYAPPVVIKKIQSPFFSQIVEAPLRPVSRRISQASARDSKPESHVTEPISHVTKPESHVTESISHVTKPESHVTEPISHMTKPESHVPVPAGHVTKTESHVTNSDMTESVTEDKSHPEIPSPPLAEASETQSKPTVEKQRKKLSSKDKPLSLSDIHLSVDVKPPDSEPLKPEQPLGGLTTSAKGNEPVTIFEPASPKVEHVKEDKPKPELQSSKLSTPEASETFYRSRSVVNCSLCTSRSYLVQACSLPSHLQSLHSQLFVLKTGQV